MAKDEQIKVLDVSVATDKDNTSLFKSDEEKKKEEIAQSQALITSEEDQELLNFITKRFTAMKNKRGFVDKDWSLRQKQYEAIYTLKRDGASSVNVPLEYAVVETYVSEAITRKTKFDFDPVGPEDVEKAKGFEKVWTYDWVKYNREVEFIKQEYTTAIFGTSVTLDVYETQNTIIQDPVGVKDGVIQFEKKIRKEGRIRTKNLDIRNCYIDDRVNDGNESEDFIYIEYKTPEEVALIEKTDKNFQNLDKIGTVKTKQNQVFTSTSEKGESEQEMVEFLHYWNWRADKYVVIGNKKQICRNQPNLYAHKKLPIAVRQYSFNPFSPYGRGLCEILASFKSEINTLKETLLDSIKRSNSETIAIGSGLEFVDEDFGYKNTVMKFAGQLSGNFQQLTGTPPNNAAFEYLKELFRDVATFAGIDVQSILGQPSKTAFETAVQQESSLKRVNVVLKNRDIAMQRFAKIHASNIMQFYPIKLVRELIPIKNGKSDTEGLKSSYPKIGMDDEEFIKGRFRKKKGKNMFEVTPEAIRGQFDIQVKTNLNAPTLKQLERNNLIEFLNAVTQFSAAIQQDPALAEMIPAKDFIKELAFKFNIDIEGIGADDDDIDEQKQQLFGNMEKLSQAINGGQLNQAGGAAPGAMPQEGVVSGQPQSAINAPGVRTPDVPQLATA